MTMQALPTLSVDPRSARDALTAGTRVDTVQKPRRKRSKIAPFGFLLPYFLVTCVFFLYPLWRAIFLSFQHTNGAKSRAFVGLANFRFVLTDGDFQRAMHNTVIFTICSIFLQLPLSLGLAMLLNARQDKFKGFFRLL